MSWRNYGKTPGSRKPKADGKPRRKPVDWEGQEQAILIRWLYGEMMRGTSVGDLYAATYHVPNGGYRLGKEAGRMKAQGVKAGVSDLPVMEARGGWFGLYLEFKATPPRDAELTPSQREWLEEAEARGYCAALALGLEEAKAVLREYASWVKTAHHRGERLALTNGTEWRRGHGDGNGSNGNAGE
ncbi:VRR-NUC domain-containing protein [Halomonas sp. I1]|uniref:VRR-NUC domain-containing protein n=1 Tax=Halomonas sp. I1 TaxID=393536 RepID=UPI0028DD7FB4|nr:VRR-NUC domain-containing protein [Halomonas sp. I1]MDT8895464.1 VRR-NUC domain-containing protein [Halomonas sp. I1]